LSTRWKGQSLIYLLPARSVTTFKWPDRPNAAVEVWVTTADQIRLLEKQLPAEFQQAIFNGPIAFDAWPQH
jgi:hypothetical protein